MPTWRFICHVALEGTIPPERETLPGWLSRDQLAGDREPRALSHCCVMSNWDPPPDRNDPTRDDAVQIGELVIGDAILAGRLKVGLSQRQLGWRVGVSQSTISRLETGSLRGLRFRKLAMIVGVIRLDTRFALPDEPAAPNRRLPGSSGAVADRRPPAR